MVTPVVTLVVGGDSFTEGKVEEITTSKNPGSVVIVRGSGSTADTLAAKYNPQEKITSRQDLFFLFLFFPIFKFLSLCVLQGYKYFGGK